MPSSGAVPSADEVRARLQRQTETLRVVSMNTVDSEYNLWLTGAISLDTLCARAGDAFDDYAAATFDALNGSGEAPAAAGAPKLIREHYRQAVLSVAQAIRDAIPDSSARHAVAQTLQTRTLRAEARFRRLIEEPR